jgi:hypothetical protein
MARLKIHIERFDIAAASVKLAGAGNQLILKPKMSCE